MTVTDDLDLSAYDRDVVEHALVGRARSRMFRARHDSVTWSIALDRTEIDIGGRTFGAQLLGTHARASDTFLWSWANPAAAEWSPDVLDVANELRERGSRAGNAVFREPKVAARWVNPYELAWVAGELAGGLPIFAGEHGGTTAFVAVVGVDDPPDPELLDPAYLPGMILELHLHIAADPQTCVRVFAERLGFEIDEDERTLRARRADCGFVATFDAQGRPQRVEMSPRGHADATP